MRPADNIKQAFKDLHLSTRADLDARIETEIRVLAETKHVPNTWRIHMRSRTGKVAIAAAVIFAVMLGLNKWSGPGSNGVVWGDVQAAVERTPTVVYRMTNELEGKSNQVYHITEKVYNGGLLGHRIDSYMDGQLAFQKFLDFEERTAYFVSHDKKTYTRMIPEGDFEHEQNDPRTWVKIVLSEDYEKLGPSQINGIEVEGIEVQNSSLLCGGIVRIWVDKRTNLPVKMELQGQVFNEGAQRPMTFLMEDFQWDVALEPEFLKPNIPDGYREVDPHDQARQSTEEKPSQTLSADEHMEQPKVKEVAERFLQACSQKNWTEILKHRPGFQDLTPERRTEIETLLGGMEIIRLDEPFKKEGSDIWHVPGTIKWNTGMKDGDVLRIRYDKSLGRYIVCGGP